VSPCDNTLFADSIESHSSQIQSTSTDDIGISGKGSFDLDAETIRTTSRQVTGICDTGHSTSSTDVDVQMMRSTVLGKTSNPTDDIGISGKGSFDLDAETITTMSRQVTGICDTGHSTSSTDVDVQMMRSTVVGQDFATFTNDDVIGKSWKRASFVVECALTGKKIVAG
jgi:UDP-N-acetylglucosamine pyrophosphorylase